MYFFFVCVNEDIYNFFDYLFNYKPFTIYTRHRAVSMFYNIISDILSKVLKSNLISGLNKV